MKSFRAALLSLAVTLPLLPACVEPLSSETGDTDNSEGGDDTGGNDTGGNDTGGSGAGGGNTAGSDAGGSSAAGSDAGGSNAGAGGASHLSGLPWASGFSACNNSESVLDEIKNIGAWRGRPLDTHVSWNVHDTWAHMEAPDGSGGGNGKLATIGELKSRLSIGMAMLVQTDVGQFDKCVAGDYDSHYKAYAQALVDSGNADAIVRVGWEANGGWYPWAIEKNGVDHTVDYKACFRHIRDVLKAKSADFSIDWTMAKEGGMTHNVADAYPGDDAVDIIGVDYYDSWKPAMNEIEWQERIMETKNGGPKGLQRWLDFAKSHDKPLSIPEWGVMGTTKGGAGDNPFYIGKMYEFFKEHAASIHYESYFNCGGIYDTKVFPDSLNPESSAEYVKRWKPGN